ncbi:PQQ-binding-like beta-propeller repeat protein [Streptomyces asoensis]|uniref:outer membrane protein assembly factor BamB family protein n=1 Tax=Streptomyces asoensis TaxID=249586 RepID=UPI0033CA6C3F
MTTEQVEGKVRETLHAVALDGVRAPGDLVEKVMRRRARRRAALAAGSVAAVAAIAAGAALGFGGDGAPQDRPPRPAVSPTAVKATPPDGWQPWRSDVPGAGERGCLVDGSALYCAGSAYDAAKFDAGTGERLWTVKVNREGDGIDHPFAVLEGVVFAYRNHTSHNQLDGDYAGGTDLMAVDAAGGKVLWTAQMPQDDRTGQAAMVIDGAVLANTPSLRTVSALDPRTGQKKWSHSWDKGTVCQRAALGGVPYLLCSLDTEKPAVTDVVRLDPASGRAVKVTTLPGRQELMGTSEDRMFLFHTDDPTATAGGEGRVTVLNGSGQRTSHPYRVQGQAATSAIVGDRLITVSFAGKASAYSLTTGRVLWSRPAGVDVPDRNAMPGMASPVGSAQLGVVYFLGPGGDVSALDLRTGAQLWRDHVDLGTPGPGLRGAPQMLLYGDALIARNESKLVSFLPRIGD